MHARAPQADLSDLVQLGVEQVADEADPDDRRAETKPGRRSGSVSAKAAGSASTNMATKNGSPSTATGIPKTSDSGLVVTASQLIAHPLRRTRPA